MSPNAKRPGPPQSGLANTDASDHTDSSLKDTTRMPSYGRTSRLVAPQNGARDFPAARAHAMPPCPGRTMWVVAVLTCPLCAGGHTHRSGDDSMVLSGKLLRRCPTTGRVYRLGPVRRCNEARRTIRLALAA